MNRKNIILTTVALAAMSLLAIAFFQSIVAVDNRAAERLEQRQQEEEEEAQAPTVAVVEESTSAIKQCSNGMWAC
jgi:Flp pilus assembly protein TadB